MRLLRGERFLVIYSGVLTVALGVIVFGGFAKAPGKTSFDENDVHRINVVEPDGTLRMVVSDRTQFPGLILKGKQYPHGTRKTAGILFFNDEGTENGGLIFGGARDKNGKVESWGHLSFDQYMQDQVFTIDAGEEDGKRHSGVAIWDRGDYPIIDAIDASARIGKLPEAQRQGEWDKFHAEHSGDAKRAYLGRAHDRSVGLWLKDDQGRDRIVLRVNADGSPVLQFLDAEGKMVVSCLGLICEGSLRAWWTTGPAIACLELLCGPGGPGRPPLHERSASRVSSRCWRDVTGYVSAAHSPSWAIYFS